MDHVPTKSLLVEPLPENPPKVMICKSCNSGFSSDEEYFGAFLASVLAGSTDPDQHTESKMKRGLRRNAGLRTRIEGSKSEFRTLGGKTRTVWTPEQNRIDRVLIKNARGHAYYEIGEPILGPPDGVWSAPLETLTVEQRENFENLDLGPAYPEVGSRLMQRMFEGQDLVGPWILVQDGIYRYGVAQIGTVLVRSVIREYLATEVYWGPDSGF